MKSQQLFCGACDRPVRVLITDTPTTEGQATADDAEVVCLEIGAQCTGNLCPLGAAEPGRDGAPHRPQRHSRSGRSRP